MNRLKNGLIELTGIGIMLAAMLILVEKLIKKIFRESQGMATVRAIKLYGAFQGYGNQSDDTIEDVLEIFPNEETAQEYLIQFGPSWTLPLNKIMKFLELGRQLGDRSFEKFPGIQAQYDSESKYQGSWCTNDKNR